MFDVDDATKFMAFIFVIGLYLLVVSSKVDRDIEKNIRPERPSNTTLNCNKGILVISIIFISVSLNFLIQRLNSCSCPAIGKLEIFTTKEAYITFFLLLGIVLTTLASKLKASSSKLYESSGSLATTIFIGAVLIIVCGGYIGMNIYNNQRVGVLPSSRM